jgi:hypothetical protein
MPQRFFVATPFCSPCPTPWHQPLVCQTLSPARTARARISCSRMMKGLFLRLHCSSAFRLFPLSGSCRPRVTASLSGRIVR